jgi:hypothetical protein
MTDKLVFGYPESFYWAELNRLQDESLGLHYRKVGGTGRHISKYDENGDLTDIHPTDLVENPNCETCEHCEGKGCQECDFDGYIDWSEPNGMN